MKRNFGDHSANERTFLAWIRTSIAIMAFGFLVEKFTIFLNITSIALKRVPVASEQGAALLGLALVLLGTVMIAVATGRFILLEREIDRAEQSASPSTLPDVLLAALLVTMGLFLAFYLSHRLFA